MPLDQLRDRPFLALEMRLDRAVAGIADPAGDAQRARLARRPVAEEDALHPADTRAPCGR